MVSLMLATEKSRHLHYHGMPAWGRCAGTGTEHAINVPACPLKHVQSAVRGLALVERTVDPDGL